MVMQEKAPLTQATLNEPFWNLSPDETLAAVFSSRDGLTTGEATRRRALFGPNSISEQRLHSGWPGFPHVTNPWANAK